MCDGDGHNWVARQYAVRHGEQEMRVCDGCGRAELALSAQRSRAHVPAQTNTATAA